MEPKAPFARCEECPLRDRAFVPTYAAQGDIAVIGEAPGFEEARLGRPFVGPSGKLLAAALEQEGVAYRDVWRSNVVACHPRGNATPNAEAIACCAPRLEAELAAFEGRTIIPLGAVATQQLTGAKTKMASVRGRWSRWQGKNILPTWHPAYILRFPGAVRAFLADIARAVEGEADHYLQSPPPYIPVESVDALKEVLDAISGPVAFDIETSGFKWFPTKDAPPDRLLMLGLAWRDGTCIISPDVIQRGRDVLNRFFVRKDLHFIAQNGKFDTLFLRAWGVEARLDFDTLLAEYVLWEGGGYALEDLALYYFGLDDYKQSILGPYKKIASYDEIPYDILSQYCAWDCVVTLELYRKQEAALVRQRLWDAPFLSLVMPTSRAATEMEWNGINVDGDYLFEQRKRFEEITGDLERYMQELSGEPELNPRSPKQVSEVIYKKLRLPSPESRKVKRDSTAKEALRHILPGENEFIDALRSYRRVHKMLTSYIAPLLEGLDANQRVHTNVKVHGTEIGRLSMTSPALQTIPRDTTDPFGAVIRGSFVASPGKRLVIADYSQAELRVAACLSLDPFLLEVYRNDRDLHMEVAIGIYGEDATKESRSDAKRFNFAYLYGGTEYSFAEDSGMSISKARAFVRRYKQLMAKLEQWKREVFQEARKRGYVTSRTGRVRRFPVITSQTLDEVRKSAPHFLVAGPASDLTLMSMNELSQRWSLVLNVHDSVLFEVPERDAEACAKDVQATMIHIAEEWFPEVPWKVDVEITERWGKPPEDDELRVSLARDD